MMTELRQGWNKWIDLQAPSGGGCGLVLIIAFLENMAGVLCDLISPGDGRFWTAILSSMENCSHVGAVLQPYEQEDSL